VVLFCLFLCEAGLRPAHANPPSAPAFAAMLQDTTRPGGTDRISRRARAVQRRMGLRDTTATVIDSTIRQILVATRDSSARLEQFHHVRKDVPAVNPLLPSPHALYLKEPPIVRTVETLDSAAYVYRISKVVGTEETRIPLTLTLEEYREVRLTRSMRQYWQTLTRQREEEEEKKQGLGEVFGQLTNIEIPVPKNPLFSIFGKNQIRIQINGSVDIHGAFRNTESDQKTNNILDQSRSEPDFDQQVRVGVRGEIGDKLKIDADWDTERTFEYENQLRVKYTGYEDEIIQSVEAGNVSLQTNSSFVTSSQALFGVKAGMQFGPLKLTALASQKRGQPKEISVSSGQRSTPFEKKLYEYSRDHFFVDTLYRAHYETAYKKRPLEVDAALQILDLEVWVSKIESVFDPTDRDAVAFISRDSVLFYQNNRTARESEIVTLPGIVEVGRFKKLVQNVDYSWNPNLGIISMNKAVQPAQIIAVAYTLPPNTDIGTFESKDTSRSLPLILKLVKPKNLHPGMRPAWDLMLKNIYSLGGRDISSENFNLQIKYRLPGGNPFDIIEVNGKSISLLNLFGLDLYNNETGAEGEDKRFDFDPGVTIDTRRGEVVFPTLEPFAENIRSRFEELFAPGTPQERAAVRALADSFAVDVLYDTTYNGAQTSKVERFTIEGSIISSTQSKFNLGFNVAEGSVSVRAGNTELKRNEDYTVDYLTGTVVILNPIYLVPGTNLQINYEANDLFQLASKSLVGARAEMQMSKTSHLGFTIMNLNQESLNDKVRLNEEPISNTIMGFDGSTTFEVDAVTRALNWLPGIRTNAPSSITLRGEAAYMLPDPNTRKSTISQDGDAGVAYIDDFEGVRRIIPLQIGDGAWRDASPPTYISTIDPYAVPTGGFIDVSNPVVRQNLLPDTSKMEFKARLAWFNILPIDVLVSEIWPTRQTRSAAEDNVTTLNLFFRPSARGPFNYSMNLEDSLYAQPAKGWAGVMRPLSTITANLLDENITFIEMWVRVEEEAPGARLNIDLGTVSEDVIPNRILNTEDGLGGRIKTGVMDNASDLGLDMLSDAQERVSFAAFVAKYQEFNGDPSGDNYVREIQGSFHPEDYLGKHGTEGNYVASAQGGQYPDTEDLNNNNVVDRAESYFEYEVDLDTTSTGFKKYVTGGEPGTGWYQLRIPIKEFTRQVGTPSLTNIETIRMWVTGATKDLHVKVTEFNLVGNQWEKVDKNDDDFRLSNVGIEENPYYTSPPGVRRPLDRTRPDQVIEGNEQSLAMQITNLADGQSKRAFKKLIARPLDVLNYQTMKLFIHGDERPGFYMQYVDTSNYDAEFFFRFGSDSLNYYEYRAPIRPGWHPANWITIRFADLTSFKLDRDSVTAIVSVPVPGGPDGAVYRVFGNPSLNRITELVLGVENPAGKGATVVNGEVWVNELRLSDVDDTPGWAYRADATIKLADIATIGFGMTRRDPFFHGLEQHFGSRVDERNWAVNTQVALEKFLPSSWTGSRATFTYSHSEGLSTPRYVPGTDILVDKAAQRTSDRAVSEGGSGEEAERQASAVQTEAQTLNITESYAFPTLQLKVPSDFWLVEETINRMSFSYSYSSTERRSPTTERFRSWAWNVRLNYALQFSSENYVQPFAPVGEFFLFSPFKGVRLFYLPRNLSLSTSFARSRTRERVRGQAQDRPVVRNFESTRQMSFSWPLADGGRINPTIDYSADVTSSLVHFELDQFGRQRSLFEIIGDMFGRGGLIDFGLNRSFRQNIALSTRMVVPEFWKLDKIIAPSFRYSSAYDWVNSLQAGPLGRSAGRTVSSSASLDINLKVLGDEIWPPQTPVAPADTAGMSIGRRIDQISRVLIKFPFFDWDRLTLSLTHSNSARNSGVVGNTGFLNVFGRVPFIQGSSARHGPSLLYQLGLSSDPHGDVVIGTKGTFPFFTGSSRPGLRAPNGTLSDIYSQTNNLSMRTSRRLWQGARLDLTWTLGWSYNLNRTIRTDSVGVPTEVSRTVTGELSRSFITFPNSSIFKVFKTGITEVNKRFEFLKGNLADRRGEDLKLIQAFEEGMEAVPFGKNLISALMPRPNWSIRWDGLEKLPLFSGFASSVVLDHSYSSTFRRRWRLTPTGGEVTESEGVMYGFTPLVGITVTFKPVGNGNLTGNIRFSSTTSYDLSPAIQTISESHANDITISANYSRRGFEFPFFGLSLSNDLDVSFSYSYSKNNRRVYDFSRPFFKEDGDPLGGTVRTIIEPRIRYILSSRVTASIYYKYTRLKPDEGGSLIPGSTINEGGLDIRVQIS
jgi:cell surface protein SprA